MQTNALSLGDRVATPTCGDHVGKALALVADGMPYRDAAHDVGYADHREVYPSGPRSTSWDVWGGSLVVPIGEFAR